jgi:hypothetical protein
MSRSYIRSHDGVVMLEIAPHQYVNRKIFRLREYHGDGYQQGKTPAASAEASAERAEAA